MATISCTFYSIKNSKPLLKCCKIYYIISENEQHCPNLMPVIGFFIMNNIKNILEIKNLFYSIEQKQILNDINFSVQNGEFLSLLGPSGCGKTTILRLLIGLLQPDSGQIIKNGKDITHAHPSKRGMGIVFQNYALFENMTAFENIEYALKLNPKFKTCSKDIVNDLLVQMNLIEHADKKPINLSGGQQQRVAIARTLAIKPDIILFDEPMSALDVETRLVLRKELKDLQSKYKNTMIYITHDQEEAFAMSDRIMVMSEGKIHQIDTPENLIAHPADDYVNQFVVHNLRVKMDSLLKHLGGMYEK